MLIRRLLLAFALVWTMVLLLQNISILAVLTNTPRGWEVPAIRVFYLFAAFKAVLLVTTAFAALAQRNRLRLAIFGATVVFAYPFGLLLQQLILPPVQPEVLIYLSALASYAAAGALAYLAVKAGE
jgi:hypothetical protein